MELGVSSRYSRDLATGTGTDQICIAAPMDESRYAYGATNPHSKLGELLGTGYTQCHEKRIAVAERAGTVDHSRPHSCAPEVRLFEAAFLDAMRNRLNESSMELLEKNRNAVLFEPQAAAAAFAFASVLDRVRFGVLPPSMGGEVLRHQAATIAASLSTQIENWSIFWRQIKVDVNQPMNAVYDAIGAGLDG